MKFIDTFNEDDKKKLIKRSKLIYSVLKKGTITRSDGVKFSYELGDNMVPSVVNGEIELFAFITKITERTYCPINEIAMSDLIIKKFEQFDIKVDLQIPKSIEIVKYQGKKPWEEQTELNEEIDIDKERNRVKTVHKAIRKGIVNVSGTRFRYELPEDYTFHVVDEPHLQVTAIKFTFYYKDLTSDVGGGHGLPLKIWRIEDGKDVYLNKMLTGKDVGEITHYDEYAINTKTGVEYVNAKNKVRNRYRNFNINAIMTTPGDSINESEDKHEQRREKMIKKGKTVFKALRKGIISDEGPDGLRFSYELSNDFTVDVNNLGIVVYTDGVKIKKLNKACDAFSPGYKMSRIRNKFYQFDIVLTYPNVTYKDVEQYVEPINEEKDNNLTEKDKKKAHLIYKTFKTGKYQVDDLIYRYELPDEYWISKDEEGNPVVVLTMHPEQKMKLYATMSDWIGDKHELPVDRQYKSLYTAAEGRIEKKFQQFNVDIIF